MRFGVPIAGLLALVAAGCTVKHSHHYHVAAATPQGVSHMTTGAPGGVYAWSEPPQTKVETIPAQPADGWVWIDGYWHWDGSQWVWIDGAWMPPRGEMVYVESTYTWYGTYCLYVPGYWEEPHRLRTDWIVRDRRRPPRVVRPRDRNRNRHVRDHSRKGRRPHDPATPRPPRPEKPGGGAPGLTHATPDARPSGPSAVPPRTPPKKKRAGLPNYRSPERAAGGDAPGNAPASGKWTPPSRVTLPGTPLPGKRRPVVTPRAPTQVPTPVADGADTGKPKRPIPVVNGAPDRSAPGSIQVTRPTPTRRPAHIYESHSNSAVKPRPTRGSTSVHAVAPPKSSSGRSSAILTRPSPSRRSSPPPRSSAPRRSSPPARSVAPRRSSPSRASSAPRRRSSPSRSSSSRGKSSSRAKSSSVIRSAPARSAPRGGGGKRGKRD